MPLLRGGAAAPIKQMQRYLRIGTAGEVRQRTERLMLSTSSQYGKRRNLNSINIPPLKARRRELRNNPTPAEAILWKHLHRRQMLRKKFRQCIHAEAGIEGRDVRRRRRGSDFVILTGPPTKRLDLTPERSRLPRSRVRLYRRFYRVEVCHHVSRPGEFLDATEIELRQGSCFNWTEIEFTSR